MFRTAIIKSNGKQILPYCYKHQLSHSFEYNTSNIFRVSRIFLDYIRSLQVGEITGKYEKQERYLPYYYNSDVQKFYCLLIHHLFYGSNITLRNKFLFYINIELFLLFYTTEIKCCRIPLSKSTKIIPRVHVQ